MHGLRFVVVQLNIIRTASTLEGENTACDECNQHHGSQNDIEPRIVPRIVRERVKSIGDSITAGVHSEGGNMTYPAQLQTMLDTKYPGKYKVTNLGACGSTMMKGILLKYS